MSTDMLAITNARVVTVDAQGSIIDNATIVVDENGLICEIASGTVAHTATTVIDARGGIVMPGLINAHAHLGMTLFRGLGDDMNLEDFLARLMPAEISILNHDAVVAGTELGALESSDSILDAEFRKRKTTQKLPFSHHYYQEFLVIPQRQQFPFQSAFEQFHLKPCGY